MFVAPVPGCCVEEEGPAAACTAAVAASAGWWWAKGGGASPPAPLRLAGGMTRKNDSFLAKTSARLGLFMFVFGSLHCCKIYDCSRNAHVQSIQYGKKNKYTQTHAHRAGRGTDRPKKRTEGEERVEGKYIRSRKYRNSLIPPHAETRRSWMDRGKTGRGRAERSPKARVVWCLPVFT